MKGIEMRHAVLTQRLQSCTIKYNEKAILWPYSWYSCNCFFALFSTKYFARERDCIQRFFDFFRGSGLVQNSYGKNRSDYALYW